MANILGKYLIEASNNYKNNKKDNQSYVEFFSSKYPLSLLNNQEASNLIEDFIMNKMNPGDREFSDYEIEVLINNLHKSLMDIKVVDTNFNTGEFLGYILLGNVLNAK